MPLPRKAIGKRCKPSARFDEVQYIRISIRTCTYLACLLDVHIEWHKVVDSSKSDVLLMMQCLI